MRSSPATMLDPSLLQVSTHRLDVSFAAHAFLKQMGVAEHIDTLVAARREEEGTLAPKRATGQFVPTGPTAGQCVEAMVLNVLEGRVALYNMETWLHGLPVEAMWGSSVTSEQLEDMRLALLFRQA